MGEYVDKVNPSGSAFGQEHSVIDGMNRLMNTAASYAELAASLVENMQYEARP